MSGFYLLALTGLWLLVGWVIFRLWRKWKPARSGRKALHLIIGLLLFILWFGGAFWEVTGKKMYWDARVLELCAKDGGIRVYETVELPAEKFNRWGQINFYRPNDGESALGPDYLVKNETCFLRAETEEPSIVRHHFQVFRRSDGKLLGEAIRYGRGGGDLPGFWHPSSYSCPDYQKGSLLEKLFINSSVEGTKNEHD